MMTASSALRLSAAALVLFSSVLTWSGTAITAPVKKPAKAQAQLPTALAEVEAHYGKTGSLSAAFDQEEVSAVFGEKKSSKGTIAWKAPNSLRWETKSPEASLLVSNGKTVWMYTPPFDETENGQVIVRKASQVKSRLLDALLAGRFSSALKQGLAIETLKNRSFALKPRRGTAANLKQATVELAEKEPIIMKVSLEYRDGNRSTISFSEVEMGTALGKELFEFKTPPRTDILKE